MSPAPLSRRLAAETIGTGFLVCCVVGSGIMAERLFPASIGLALLANSIATGGVLVALILALGDISSHFNPIVSLSEYLGKQLSARDFGAYALVQIAGGLAGIAIAHAMFGSPVVQFSIHPRAGISLWLSEAVATFGLLLVIAGASRVSQTAVAIGVGAYITAAYWFTSSTSFANPAVTIARAFTHSFAGIRPSDVPVFLVAQLIGAAAALVVANYFRPRKLTMK